ncbi:HAD-IIB family hydrolase [Pectinatus sottacetonis]|uniref:HAD-IIB family hydrolase n=1 Tax=Pectinatus sottacetonis TaxID=1002795 RepID=UPI0018C4AC73|nr:HAD-IIB family hydrolase [Pectinatus sottacetonis]
MKVAASDFDCTLFFPPKHFPSKAGIAKSDIEAITKWQKAGHRFGIVTGRNYQMLLKDTDSYDLQLDFAVCLTGAVVYGKNSNIVEQNPIDNIISRNIMLLPIFQQSRHIACFTPYATYVCIQSETSWFSVIRDLAQFITQIDFFTAECLKGICQISLQYDSAAEAAIAAKQINNLNAGVMAYCNVTAVDIVRDNINKSAGLETVLTVNNWQKNKILTIGDGINDLPMIKKFAGFTVNTADEAIKRYAVKTYDNIADMLNDNF